MSILDTLLNVGTGGVFGLIGAGVTKFADFKNNKLKFAHEVAMAGQERENMTLEMGLAKVRGEIDLELEESRADAISLSTAIEAESKITGTSQWVADLRGSTRPFLTYGLCMAAVAMSSYNPQNPMNNEIIFMASTAVTFWFGSRPSSKK